METNGIRPQDAQQPREALTRLVIDRPVGQLGAAMRDDGEWEVRVRRSKDEEWRVACKGNLSFFSVSTDLARPITGPIVFGSLHIDPAGRKVLVDDADVGLTKKEFDLLLTLAKEPRRVVPKEELFEEVWKYSTAFRSRTLESHVSRVRGKLRRVGANGLIVNCWGVGFSLLEPESLRP